MKTIQEVIRELDPIQIDRGYFYEHEWEIWELPPDKFDGITIGELKERRSKRFQEFLKELMDIDPVPPEDGKQGILFLSKSMNTRSRTDRELFLAHADEILSAESFDYDDFSCYDFSFSPREKCMSFWVAENKLTQDHLLTVAIEFIYNLSIFGYDYADVEKVIEDIDRSIERSEKDIEAGRFYTVEESMDQLHEKLGFPKDEVYPREKEFRHKCLEAEMEYNQYYRTVELQRIKDYLLKHMDEVYPNAETITVSLDEPCPMGALMTDIDGILNAIEESKRR